MRYVFCLLSFSFLSNFAHAGLGDSEAQVASDSVALHFKQQQHQVEQLPAYSVHALQSGRQTIRQYVNHQGNVFAVTWQGSQHPNLPVLLGSQYKTFQAQRPNGGVRHGRGPTTIHVGNMVIHFGGHGRDLRGVAYLSNLVPSGINPESF